MRTGRGRPRRRIAAAGFALMLGAADGLFGPGRALAGERLDTAAIEAIFRGMTLDGIYRDGEIFSETYGEDGAIRYHGLSGADRGEWSAVSGRFCTFYEGAEGGCFVVERDGANCFTFFVDEGGETPKPAADWTSRGWNRDKPSTCPTAPEANT